MDPTPQITNLEDIQERSGYKAVESPRRPPYWGVDRDPERRPGVPRMRDPDPWPNTRYPPERQSGEPTVPKHGRPNKPFPPVFGTSCPLHGLSGAIKTMAYALPDHKTTHWMLMMLGDRVESWGIRARRAGVVALPIAALAILVRLARG